MSMIPRGYESFSTLSPQQQSLLDQLLPQLIGNLEGKNLEKFAAPYKREFQEKIIPGLAERFAGLGAGSQSSSAFQQALGSAGAGLAENLATLGAQQQQASISPLLSILSMNTQGLIPQKKSFLEELLLGLSGGIGQGIGTLSSSYLGGIL